MGINLSENLSKDISKIYLSLLRKYGPQGWWPLSNLQKPVGDKEQDQDFQTYRKFNPDGTLADFKKNWPRHLGIKPKTDKQKLEIMLGAILTQNTNWDNVSKVIYALNQSNLMDKKKLLKIKEQKLAQIIHPSGYYHQKARKIKILLRFLDYRKRHSPITRENLLNLWGIGPETADSILLYAYNRPFFIVDTYTKRVFSCLNFISKKESKNNFENYHFIQEFFHSNLPKKPQLFQQYHALIVKLAKDCCKTKPFCSGCPLKAIKFK